MDLVLVGFTFCRVHRGRQGFGAAFFAVALAPSAAVAVAVLCGHRVAKSKKFCTLIDCLIVGLSRKATLFNYLSAGRTVHTLIVLIQCTII